MIHVPSREALDEAHAVAIERYGGTGGSIRDRETLLESAIGAVHNRILFAGESDAVVLSGLLGARVSQAHAYLDGDKRVAAYAVQIMLAHNGFRIEPGRQMELADLVLGLASGRVNEEAFISGIKGLAVPMPAAG